MATTEKLVIETPVYMIVRGAACRGQLRCAPKGFAFEREATGKRHTFQKADIDSCETKRVARGHQLRVVMKTGGDATFEGFKADDMNRLLEFFQKHYQLDIKIIDLSLKGHNYGNARFQGNYLVFDVDDNKPAFEVPLKAVGNVTHQKHEASIDFIQDEDVEDNAQRVESMRFLVIPDPELIKEEEFKKTEEFVENIKERASIAEYTSRAIASLDTISFLVPRGRFQVELYPSFMQLRGSTYDHRLFFDYITHIYLLPHEQEDCHYMVLSVDPPLRHGQTRYPHVLIKFTRKDDASTEEGVEVNVTREDVRESLGYLTETLPADETQVMEKGRFHEVLSRLLKGLTKRKIIKPTTFHSSKGYPFVSCTLKANRGLLYPLDRGFLFLHKPVVYISLTRNLRVTFDRVKEQTSRDTKSFDMRVIHPQRGEFEFRGLGQEELQPLIDHLRAKKVAIEGLDEQPMHMEEEDDFAPSDEEDDRPMMPADFNDDTSESDHSFNEEDASESSMDSEEERELQEELVEDDMVDGPRKRGSKTRRSRQRADDEDEDVDEEDEDEGEAKKKKKKPRTASKSKGKQGPKKAKSAYTLWSAQERAAIKEKHPDMSFGDVNKQLGQAWKELSDEERAKWEDKAKEDRQRYLEEKKKFDAENPDAATKTKRMRKKKDPNAPKGAKSAYIIFSQEMRDKVKQDKPDLSLTQISQECGKLWRKLSAEEKKKYEDLAAEDKKRYEQEMAEYKANKADSDDDDGDDDGDEAAGGKKTKKKRAASDSSKKSKKAKASTKQATLNFKSAETVESSESE